MASVKFWQCIQDKNFQNKNENLKQLCSGKKCSGNKSQTLVQLNEKPENFWASTFSFIPNNEQKQKVFATIYFLFGSFGAQT